MAPPDVKPSPHRFLKTPHKGSASNEPAVLQKAAKPPKNFTPSRLKETNLGDGFSELPSPQPSNQFPPTRKHPPATRAPSPKRARLTAAQAFATPPRFAQTPKQVEIDSALLDSDRRGNGPHSRAESPFQHARPAFLASSHAPHSDPDDAEPPPNHAARPVFLKPQEPARQTVEPLPEAFSPHRRGQKFVPGGMAAEVRQWIIDTSSASSLLPRPQNQSDGRWRASILESRKSVGEGPVLVKAQLEGGTEVHLLLPDSGKGREVERIREGAFIAVRPPTWQVQVAGISWVVAADWQVT